MPGRTLTGVALLAVTLAACADPSPGRSQTGPLVVQIAPFQVSGQERGADYVGWAFAQSLTNGLRAVEGLRVVEPPRAPVEQTAPAETEGVTRLVTGTLARAGEEVLAQVRLLEADSRTTLWEIELASEGGDLSELAFRLARLLAEGIGLEYPGLYEYIIDVVGGPELSSSPRATAARSTARRYDIDRFLEETTALVEEFADDPAANVLHAWALTMAWDSSPTSEMLARLRDRLDALDRVDPDSPYDELLRAFIYRSSGEPEQARILYTRVLERDDLSARARAWALRQRSFNQLQLANAVAAREDAARAVSLDPSTAPSLLALSKILESLGLVDDAVSASERAIALEPYRWRHIQRLGLVYASANRLDEANRYLEQACRTGNAQEVCANFAVTLQRSQRDAEAREAAEHAETLSETRWGAYNLACFWSLAGERDVALQHLRHAVDLGFADALVNTDPDLDSLRERPEFQAIVAEITERLSIRQKLSQTAFPWQA